MILLIIGVSGLPVEEPDPQQDKVCGHFSVRQLGGDTFPLLHQLKVELMELICNASSEDNPVFTSHSADTFTDLYGDVHDMANDTNINHFLCRQLFLHFTEHVSAQSEALLSLLFFTLSLTLFLCVSVGLFVILS